MSNITFEVPRLSTFVFKKFSERAVFYDIHVHNVHKHLFKHLYYTCTCTIIMISVVYGWLSG